jgi:hypothetical protein
MDLRHVNCHTLKLRPFFELKVLESAVILINQLSSQCCRVNMGENNHGNMCLNFMSAEKHIIVAITGEHITRNLLWLVVTNSTVLGNVLVNITVLRTVTGLLD